MTAGSTVLKSTFRELGQAASNLANGINCSQGGWVLGTGIDAYTAHASTQNGLSSAQPSPTPNCCDDGAASTPRHAHCDVHVAVALVWLIASAKR